MNCIPMIKHHFRHIRIRLEQEAVERRRQEELQHGVVSRAAVGESDGANGWQFRKPMEGHGKRRIGSILWIVWDGSCLNIC